jgi:beta-exotoxin I transport system permease protein
LILMRGLITKTLYEVWLPTLLFGCGLLVTDALLTYVLPQIQAGLDEVLRRIPFIRPILSALLGGELGNELSAQTMQAFLWVHPVVLALLWAHAIVFCTRMPAGEIDRGTIDVMLGWPVSRQVVYGCDSIVWLASGVLILSMALLGHRLAALSMPDAVRPPLGRVALVLVNLYCVYVAVGGMSYLASAVSDRRGRAAAAAFGLVLASFLLNFLAQFWEPAKRLAFLSVMKYYQPAQILTSEQFPLGHVAILLCVGGVAWLVGGEIVARRSICTV